MSVVSVTVTRVSPEETKVYNYSVNPKNTEEIYKDALSKTIEFHTNEPYPLENIAIVSEKEFTYSYNSGGIVNVVVTFNLKTPYIGSFSETGAISNDGDIIFVSNIGTFTDSNSSEFKITVISESSFTIENLTEGYIYTSVNGKITPV